jgi:hypothetical protein
VVDARGSKGPGVWTVRSTGRHEPIEEMATETRQDVAEHSVHAVTGGRGQSLTDLRVRSTERLASSFQLKLMGK